MNADTQRQQMATPLMDPLERALEGRPLVLLVGADPWRLPWLEAFAARQRESGDMVALWDAAGDPLRPHSALASLVAPFQSTVALEAPELLIGFGPELAALAGDDGPLSRIALPASERRLSRESEFNFRILEASVRFLRTCLAQLPSASGRKLLVVAPAIDRLDRLTLLALDQLRRSEGRSVTIVIGLSNEAYRTLADDDEPERHLLGVEKERRRFLRDFIRTTDPEVVKGPSEWDAPQAAILAEFPNLPDEPGAILRAIQAGQLDVALASLTRPCSRLSRAERSRLLGLTHAYLGNFALALDVYEQARVEAEDPISRARASVYVALLLNKRLSELDRAQAVIETAMGEISGLIDGNARLERAWLFNVHALVHFRRRENDAAFEKCREGLAEVKTVAGSDAMHLKVNLINNMSTLREVSGDPEGALLIWQRFQKLSGAGDPLFRKVFLFRNAALLDACGRPADAYEAMLDCWRETETLSDVFHQAYVGYDLGVLAARLGQLQRAERWFERAGEAAVACRNSDAAARAKHAAALVADAPNGIATTNLGLTGSKLGRPFHLIHIPPITGASQ
ncbi:hypothetical protein B5P46_01620 [Rhizobium leguminosarum]|uniref:Tetratricopeptide repeat protein n=1 Tax=Rhizobium leguminosarum TaxID=384 RepID=A0A4Q1UFY7_RHILE|nr:hypothetical protein [Rhizobium leguminosarum]RXT29798.1 hypothetical protein B5P46_01620 [Rhizobium leguminosarum]